MRKVYVSPNCEQVHLIPRSLLENSSSETHEASFGEFDEVDNIWGA